jgi:hypothetical protein
MRRNSHFNDEQPVRRLAAYRAQRLAMEKLVNLTLLLCDLLGFALVLSLVFRWGVL